MLALITCHFNFIGYNRPRQNLSRFVLQMRSFGYPLYGVEAFLPGQVPFTRGWKDWKQIMIGKDQIMFQKESLLNVAETLVPRVYDKIAWVDADIWFQNLEWFAMTEKLLENYRVLQMFERCHFCSLDGRPFKRLPSFMEDYPSGKRSHPVRSHGIAWAAQRGLWTHCGGLYTHAIVGGGDKFMAGAFVGNTGIPLAVAIGVNLGVYQQWQQRVSTWVDQKYSFVPGDVFHEWHGTRANRAYVKRFELTQNADLARITAKADNQLLKWTEEAPRDLRLGVHKYFMDRREDG